MSEQIALFGFDAPPRVPTVRQARAVGERAGQMALEKAEAERKFDSEGCGKFFVGWLVRHGPTSGEDLTDEARKHGFHPHTGKAFGPVFKVLLNTGKIKVLRSDLPRRYGHGTTGGKLYGMVR